ncbi:conserved hypothetical protein [Desulfarculus baarsii DSM 2075]|uniref:Mu-like prophage FluMu protein gp41 n=1 Tax=Desulfarculus baarsii (strain ATCC 33931 / DSM 2075 / LMG 7858 / VKM B-1802 / 2st14) TaxID=644282 RepID=E1QHA7_DESB2|nr:phage tail assembly protein [Desulfarculus baarsii]ADK84950.1 conserved hypothetical protein [Desulfarculus baarsii DSM 2075]
MSKIKLSKAINWDGKEHSELTLELEALTGADLVAAEREFGARNPGFVGVPSLQVGYQAGVAAKALKRPVEDVLRLSAKDFLRCVEAVGGFLNA